MRPQKKKLELTRVNRLPVDSINSSDIFEGGDKDQQLSFFFRESRQAYFSKSKARDDVGQAEIDVISSLTNKPDEPIESFEAPVEGPNKADASYFEFEEPAPFAATDLRPLAQFKKLSEKYAGQSPSEMFGQRHREQLRKYVEKTKDFKGDVVFHKHNAFIFNVDNQIQESGASYLTITSLNLMEKMDHLPAGDIDDQSHPVAHIKKAGTFKYVSIESDGPKSPGDSIEMIWLNAGQAENKRHMELIQNGKHVYFWTTSAKVKSGSGLGQVSAVFELVELDLESGQTSSLKEFTVKGSNAAGWIPTSVGYARRHSAKEFPYSEDHHVKRDEFLKQLKANLVSVRELKLDGSVSAMRVSLRLVGSFDKIVYKLFEGPLDHKMHFVVSVNTEDLLRLADTAILNKLQIKQYERLAKDVGLLYVTEDSLSNGYYNLLEVKRDGNGVSVGCEKLTSVTPSAPRLEEFKQRVTSCNFKYLYDEKKKEFFLRKTSPIYPGAITICDVIMNKIIFTECDGDNCRLKVTHMRNHALSYQKISALQLAGHSQYSNFKGEQLTLSNLLASQLYNFDSKLRQQFIVSRTTKNMFRCDEIVTHLSDAGAPVQYDDPLVKVKSLPLLNCDFIADTGVRERTERLKSSKTSHLKMLSSSDWQTKERKPFLPMTKAKHLGLRYKRLVSTSGKLLLPKVTEETNKYAKRKEPSIELFEFRIAGAIPTDAEDQVIAEDHAWKIFHERVRFENDDSVQRPLIFSQMVKDPDGNFSRQNYWFTIYDFKAEGIVSQINMNFPDLIQKYELENVDVSASSEIIQESENVFSQRFQVMFYLKHQLRAKIVEYTVTWNYEGSRSVNIRHTCSKEFILKLPEALDTSVEAEEIGLQPVGERLRRFQRPPMDDQPVYMIPYMDKSNQIQGTQLIYGGAESTRVFIFDNNTELAAEKSSKTPFVKDEGYKIYKNETYGDYSAVLAYSKMSDAMLADTILNDQEKAEIIEDSVKSILNSVVFDPTLAVPWQLRDSDYNTAFLQAIDVGRGIEIFEWFSLATLKADHDDQVDMYDQCKREYEGYAFDKERHSKPSLRSLSSLLERVLTNDLVQRSDERQVVMLEAQTLDYDRIVSLQQDAFYIKGHQVIQRDIHLNHPLHYLLDLEAETDSPRDWNIEQVLKFTFSEFNLADQSHHMEAQEHLMSLLGDMIERDQPSRAYFDHFLAQKSIADPTSNRSQSLQLNICQVVEVASAPRTDASVLQAFPYQHEVHEFRQNADYTVNEYLQKQSLEEGIDSVECLFFDMRFFIFEKKVKHIKAHVDHENVISGDCYNQHLKDYPNFDFTTYGLSNLILDIVEKTDGDIRKQKIVRHIIDYQYQDTRKVNLWMLIGYTLGFFIPFFVQMYVFIEPVVLACNGMCMFTSLLLMRFELVQMSIQGCNYFSSFMNWIDLMGFFSYSFYFALRVQDPSLEMPDYKQNWEEDTLTFLSFPLIMYTSQKLLFYFKMFPAFGLFQQLVSHTIANIQVFLPFMFFWIFIFTVQMQALGAKYPLDDYPNLTEFIAIILQTWRNSLANVAVPDYSKWIENLRAEEKEEAFGLYSYTMIFLIWLIWYLNLLFILLVLTNFLISIVGNAYGDATEQDVEIIYALKSDLNDEVSLFNKWQGRESSLDSMIIVAAREDSEEADANIQEIAASLKDQQVATQDARKGL